MKKLYKERLLKLAEHLKSGKLGHKRFDFSNWNMCKWGEFPKENGCGTSGCAIGECPIVFPKHWEFQRGLPVLIKQDIDTVALVTTSGMKFFGIGYPEFEHLFTPGGQDIESFGGKKLGSNAHRASVARNIREFVARQK